MFEKGEIVAYNNKSLSGDGLYIVQVTSCDCDILEGLYYDTEKKTLDHLFDRPTIFRKATNDEKTLYHNILLMRGY